MTSGSPSIASFLAAPMIFAALAATATAQRTDPEYLWLSPSTSGSDKTQLRDLKAAADRGYRLVPMSPYGRHILVQKSADPIEPVEYIFATSAKDLDKKAAIGYHLASSSYVMARRPGITTRTHHYLELATRRRETIENELRAAAATGFRVVGLGLRAIIGPFVLSVTDTEFVATLERPVQATEAAHPEYIVLSTIKAATMQTELQAAADRGYRLRPFVGDWGATTLLEKLGTPEPIEYLVLSAAKTVTMQAEMDKASAAGYRFAGTLGSGLREFVVVMERPTGVQVRTHEQVLHASTSVDMVKRETLAQFEKGFRLVGSTSVSSRMVNTETVVILERPVRVD